MSEEDVCPTHDYLLKVLPLKTYTLQGRIQTSDLEGQTSEGLHNREQAQGAHEKRQGDGGV